MERPEDPADIDGAFAGRTERRRTDCGNLWMKFLEPTRSGRPGTINTLFYMWAWCSKPDGEA